VAWAAIFSLMFFLQDAGIMEDTYCCVPPETAVCACDFLDN
jgi:hypothetical protein